MSAMRIEKADIVTSLNGRDQGKLFIVIGTQDEYSLIADGKGRRFEKPKRKKNKHLKLESKASGLFAEKLIGEERVTNNEIRRTLAQYAADRSIEGGM
jgi:ribosomal protein L14E/L6E/L27E